jgi:heme-degrading monooxygenase HmoA
MFAVIFEVRPKPSRWEDYLAIARGLKPALEGIEGFIANERFASRREKRQLLSLSLWRDEKALIRWRALAQHHEVQEKGRSEVFEDYHLRVGEVVADTDPPPGERLVQQRLDETETGAAKAVTLSIWSGPATDLAPPDDGVAGLVRQELFESITERGRLLLLAAWRGAAQSALWQPLPGAGTAPRHLRLRIIRDYGMFDRREAPQFHPPVGHNPP